MGKNSKIGRENENWLAKYVYRRIASPLVTGLSNVNVTSVQVSVASIITSVIACFFFSLGEWKYLAVGYVFLQLTLVLDHVDGAIARYTNNQTMVGSWFDKLSGKLHKFFFAFGVTLGVFRMTNDPFYLILGNIAVFLWVFSLYISETKKSLFKSKKDVSLLKESRFKTPFPFTLMVTNVFGFLVLINQAILSLWFIIILSLNAFQQIYTVRKHHYKEKWKG
jgi:phosphatidylglycerophosphate synthase